jgi:hypothetical protein
MYKGGLKRENGPHSVAHGRLSKANGGKKENQTGRGGSDIPD